MLYYNRQLYRGENIRQRWTITVDPPIGSTGVNQYNPITGTFDGAQQSVRALKHDAREADHIEILEIRGGGNDEYSTFTENPAVWEVEPRESVDLDIYYQEKQNYHLNLLFVYPLSYHQLCQKSFLTLLFHMAYYIVLTLVFVVNSTSRNRHSSHVNKSLSR